MHAYIYAPGFGETVRDIDAFDGAEIYALPTYNSTMDEVQGLAYDPFTDHIFVRLQPGNRVRVLDRPAKAIKRAFSAPIEAVGGRDLAVRSADRNVFFTHRSEPVLVQTDLNGALVKILTLKGLSSEVWGVAHDPVRDEILVLPEPWCSEVRIFSMDGDARGRISLSETVRGISLAYDPDNEVFFASLADGTAIGVFDRAGRLLRKLPRPSPGLEVFIDVGRRAALRLF